MRRRATICHLAFTLAETLVVVIMIAIMAGGMAVSVSGRHHEYALDMARKDLESATRYASQQAAATGAACRLRFTRSFGAVQVEAQSATDPGVFEPAAGMAGREHVFPGGVCVKAVTLGEKTMQTLPEVLDVPTGEPAVIEIENLRGKRTSVQWEPYTGQVHPRDQVQP